MPQTAIRPNKKAQASPVKSGLSPTVLIDIKAGKRSSLQVMRG